MTETANLAREQLLQLIRPQDGRDWPTHEYSQLMQCESAPHASIRGVHLTVPGYCRDLEWVAHSLSTAAIPQQRQQDYNEYMRLRQAAIAAAGCTISVVMAESALSAIPSQFMRNQLYRLVQFAQTPGYELHIVPRETIADFVAGAVARIVYYDGGVYSENPVDKSNSMVPPIPHETWAANNTQQYADALAQYIALRATLGDYNSDDTCGTLYAALG